MNTYLLRWNPQESAYGAEQFLTNLRDVAEGDAVTMAWPVGERSAVRYGDRFFLLRNNDGVAMAGYFCADAIIDDEWDGDDQRFVADIEPLVWIDLDEAPTVSLADLQRVAPEVDWSAPSGTMIAEDAAARVELLFMQYLYDHQAMFDTPAAAKAWDFDLENFESIPSTLQQLLKQRYGSRCERCGKQENEVEEMAYHLILDNYNPEHPAPFNSHLHCLCNNCWFGEDK